MFGAGFGIHVNVFGISRILKYHISLLSLVRRPPGGKVSVACIPLPIHLSSFSIEQITRAKSGSWLTLGRRLVISWI